VSAEKTRISIVSYTNTLPFRWALKDSDIIRQIDLQEDIPSICAQKLKFGQVDLALVPVALLPELKSYSIESDFCIGANGKVDSVKLYSRVPLHEIKNVTLDYQSKSSITLTRVLFKFFWKLPVRYNDALPGFESRVEGNTAAVVIGDRTFALNGSFEYEYDLAEEWKKFTGLPFVFAAWISTNKLPETFITAFNKTLQHGLNHIRTAVAEDTTARAYTKEQVFFYLSERIDYRLDDAKKRALHLFLDYIEQL
jgi:chorismate dehydratase